MTKLIAISCAGAIQRGLLIGSGEIESAHHYIIQERLKLPGAWWSPAHITAGGPADERPGKAQIIAVDVAGAVAVERDGGAHLDGLRGTGVQTGLLKPAL